MKTKKPVAVICIVLLLSMLFTACDFSGSQKKEQIFYGDPDTENIDDYGFMFQKELETKMGRRTHDPRCDRLGW